MQRRIFFRKYSIALKMKIIFELQIYKKTFLKIFFSNMHIAFFQLSYQHYLDNIVSIKNLIFKYALLFRRI